MPRFTVRDATPADIESLVRLEGTSFEGDKLSRRSFRRLLGATTAACRVVTTDGSLAGYALILFREGVRLARLYSLAVAAGQRGAGLATMLLADAERISTKRHLWAMRLEVREDNRAAISLYERTGYRLVRRRAGYYADGTEARVYEKALVPSHDEDRSPRDSADIPDYIRRVDVTVPGTPRKVSAIEVGPEPGRTPFQMTVAASPHPLQRPPAFLVRSSAQRAREKR